MKKVIACLGVGAMLLSSPALAAELATVAADIDGNGLKEEVVLSGDRLASGSTYYQNLLITVHSHWGHILTAYKPDLKGGYNCILETVPVAGGKDQIMLIAGQGDKAAAVSARIFDFSKRHRVKETFGAVEDMGIGASAAYNANKSYRVSYDLNGTAKTAYNSVEGQDKLQVFNEDGSVAKPYLRPQVTSLTSLTYSRGKLFSMQKVRSADLKTVLGQLAATWENQQGAWKPTAVELRPVENKAEKDAQAMGVNAAASAGEWRLYPREKWENQVESSYPLIGVAEDPIVQNKINDTLHRMVNKGHLEDERAYKVEFAGPNLLSLIMYRQPKEGDIVEQVLNFDMRSGELISTKKMFNTENKDFLRVLGIVGKPKPANLTRVPEEWFYNGHSFVFVVTDTQAKDQGRASERAELSVTDTDLYEFVRDKSLPKSK